MNELTRQRDRRMTVREVAEALGISDDKAYRSAKELFPDLFQTGKTTYLTEAQATALKLNLRKTAEVIAAPKTALEKALLVRQALLIQQETIAELEVENAELRAKNAEMKPKAETLDKITATKSDISVRELAAILAMPRLGQNNLFQKLREDGYIDGYNRPYRQHIESGIMYEKEYYVPGLDATKRQLRITQKGVACFARKYGKATA